MQGHLSEETQLIYQRPSELITDPECESQPCLITWAQRPVSVIYFKEHRPVAYLKPVLVHCRAVLVLTNCVCPDDALFCPTCSLWLIGSVFFVTVIWGEFRTSLCLAWDQQTVCLICTLDGNLATLCSVNLVWSWCFVSWMRCFIKYDNIWFIVKCIYFF